jgi:3-phenylpropionate/trans-cinnamate dioxygenase ferredoxin component
MAKSVKVGSPNDLKPGECKTVSANGTEVALYNVGGTYYATSNTCPHRGGPMGEGSLDGDVITCPWHGFQYKLPQGNCVAPNPALKVDAYKVSVQGGELFVELP